jgi:hypothetical protein
LIPEGDSDDRLENIEPPEITDGMAEFTPSVPIPEDRPNF